MVSFTGPSSIWDQLQVRHGGVANTNTQGSRRQSVSRDESINEPLSVKHQDIRLGSLKFKKFHALTSLRHICNVLREKPSFFLKVKLYIICIKMETAAISFQNGPKGKLTRGRKELAQES